MLDLIGRKADGWIAPMATGYETKPAAQDRIDAGAIAAGRDPGTVGRMIQRPRRRDQRSDLPVWSRGRRRR
jgi:hypothetical protein